VEAWARARSPLSVAQGNGLGCGQGMGARVKTGVWARNGGLGEKRQGIEVEKSQSRGTGVWEHMGP
jgi:hypothetical protein